MEAWYSKPPYQQEAEMSEGEDTAVCRSAARDHCEASGCREAGIEFSESLPLFDLSNAWFFFSYLKDIIGEVLVSLKCLPTAQKIEVGILKFKTSSPNIKERDVYARIDVFTNHHKQKHQKSSLRAKSKVTVFNETFLFSLPDLGKSQCLILISLYETLSSGKKLIGQTTVGNQKTKFKDNHWDLMMQTLRQPVAAWHLLHI
ncbi:hypothetical protein GDO78_017546 [Eleutherodactylus coqui]|uniref:C2 domain-containing protein n=1 Tax=Eleutherodactylus coqui TaxID=57060 RepID=A0A8J6E5V2_ELECQ|nr:hypothetical protein GDO78_017546 [Eleutherodactylus coqui]